MVTTLPLGLHRVVNNSLSQFPWVLSQILHSIVKWVTICVVYPSYMYTSFGLWRILVDLSLSVAPSAKPQATACTHHCSLTWNTKCTHRSDSFNKHIQLRTEKSQSYCIIIVKCKYTWFMSDRCLPRSPISTRTLTLILNLQVHFTKSLHLHISFSHSPKSQMSQKIHIKKTKRRKKKEYNIFLYT